MVESTIWRIESQQTLGADQETVRQIFERSSRLWVGHSKIWHINGMEGIPYVKPWKTMLIKRGAATVLYLVVAFVVAGIVELLGKI